MSHAYRTNWRNVDMLNTLFRLQLGVDLCRSGSCVYMTPMLVLLLHTGFLRHQLLPLS